LKVVKSDRDRQKVRSKIRKETIDEFEKKEARGENKERNMNINFKMAEIYY
jgi:hypothetical protein